jgi:hypothetical protein
MAISQVGTATTNSAFGANAEIEMTRPTGTTTDDLVCIVAHLDDNVGTLRVNESGWTQDTQIQDAAGGDKSLTFAYKYISDIGSEPATYTVDYNNAASLSVRAICFTLRGVDSTNNLDTATQTNTGTTNSDTQDPAAITTLSNDCWAIVGCAAVQSDGDGVVPSGYTEIAQSGTAAGTAGLVMAAYKLVSSAGSEDPGTFSGMGAGADSCSFTAAVRPASTSLPIYASYYYKRNPW